MWNKISCGVWGSRELHVVLLKLPEDSTNTAALPSHWVNARLRNSHPFHATTPGNLHVRDSNILNIHSSLPFLPLSMLYDYCAFRFILTDTLQLEILERIWERKGPDSCCFKWRGLSLYQVCYKAVSCNPKWLVLSVSYYLFYW